MSTVKLQSRADISAVIHRALVEVFTLRDAGQGIVVQTAVGDDRGIGAMSGATILQGEDGMVRVEYANEGLREEVIAALTTAPEEEPAPLDLETGSVEAVEDATQEDVPQTSEVEREDEDVFEPEEPANDDAVHAAAAVQETTPVRAPIPIEAAKLALSDAVPVEQWINITFPDPSTKFAVRILTSSARMRLTHHRS